MQFRRNIYINYFKSNDISTFSAYNFIVLHSPYGKIEKRNRYLDIIKINVDRFRQIKSKQRI